MNPKWLMGVILFSVVCSIWSGLIEGTYLSGNTTSAMSTLLHLNTLKWDDLASFTYSSFVLGSTVIGSLWQMLWWDYAQFKGDLRIFQYIGIAVSVGIAFTIAITLITRK